MQQSIKKNPNQIVEFSLAEMAEILIKHQGIHEGLYNLSLQFQLAFGGVGTSPELRYPGAIVGVSHIGLAKIEEGKKDSNTVNAAEVNPAPQKSR
ncbi:MAG: hypothetical protein ACTFAL_03445 [Candidatus Electronema sp. V4]|uniref:hypothetical protein n=1 Tax=Candidatus Electronema sp. V4 TaxID=3454756 RepID=UPI0040553ED9